MTEEIVCYFLCPHGSMSRAHAGYGATAPALFDCQEKEEQSQMISSPDSRCIRPGGDVHRARTQR